MLRGKNPAVVWLQPNSTRPLDVYILATEVIVQIPWNWKVFRQVAGKVLAFFWKWSRPMRHMKKWMLALRFSPMITVTEWLHQGMECKAAAIPSSCSRNSTCYSVATTRPTDSGSPLQHSRILAYTFTARKAAWSSVASVTTPCVICSQQTGSKSKPYHIQNNLMNNPVIE